MEPENIIPTSVKLVKSGKEILFEYKKTNLLLDAPFLRAASPSAENKKHAKPQKGKDLKI